MSAAESPRVEAVPNFSEGRDPVVIDAIAAALDRGEARVLHVDPNADAHRTVVTLAGPLDAVVEALFAGISVATERIDMRRHTGAHIRVGAADVVPIVPLAPDPVALAACLEAADRLAERLAEELRLPVYLYERSARRLRFEGLPRCRRRGYENLPARFADADERPDLGPVAWTDAVARTGATVLGVRDLLVAMNFTLDSPDEGLAQRIAGAIRSAGRPGRPHRLEAVRSVGWTMTGYGGRTQVSTNLLDVRRTPPHRVLEVVRQLAGPTEVVGAELIGLCPGRIFRDAALAASGVTPPGWPPSQVVDPGILDDPDPLVAGALALGLGHLDGGRSARQVRERALEWRLSEAGLGIG